MTPSAYARNTDQHTHNHMLENTIRTHPIVQEGDHAFRVHGLAGILQRFVRIDRL